MELAMSVGRDYRAFSNKYEYVIFRDEEVVAREGFFSSSTQAKRAGRKAMEALFAAEEAIQPSLAL